MPHTNNNSDLFLVEFGDDQITPRIQDKNNTVIYTPLGYFSLQSVLSFFSLLKTSNLLKTRNKFKTLLEIDNIETDLYEDYNPVTARFPNSYLNPLNIQPTKNNVLLKFTIKHSMTLPFLLI